MSTRSQHLINAFSYIHFFFFCCSPFISLRIEHLTNVCVIFFQFKMKSIFSHTLCGTMVRVCVPHYHSTSPIIYNHYVFFTQAEQYVKRALYAALFIASRSHHQIYIKNRFIYRLRHICCIQTNTSANLSIHTNTLPLLLAANAMHWMFHLIWFQFHQCWIKCKKKMRNKQPNN